MNDITAVPFDLDLDFELVDLTVEGVDVEMPWGCLSSGACIATIGSCVSSASSLSSLS